MEFDYCLQSGVHDQEMKILEQNVDIDDQLEGGGEEDDIFYAEIRRQILLLTADDDEEKEEEEEDNFLESRNNTHPNSWSASKGSLRGGFYPTGYNCNFIGWENKNSAADSRPNWLANMRKNNGNGTGVFIPQTNNSRRNQRLSMFLFCSFEEKKKN